MTVVDTLLVIALGLGLVILAWLAVAAGIALGFAVLWLALRVRAWWKDRHKRRHVQRQLEELRANRGRLAVPVNWQRRRT